MNRILAAIGIVLTVLTVGYAGPAHAEPGDPPPNADADACTVALYTTGTSTEECSANTLRILEAQRNNYLNVLTDLRDVQFDRSNLYDQLMAARADVDTARTELAEMTARWHTMVARKEVWRSRAHYWRSVALETRTAQHDALAGVHAR